MMKNYKKITEKLNINQVKTLFSEGHIFVVALVDEPNKEIRLAVSYGVDQKAKSWVGNYYANSLEHLKRSVIMEGLEPYYAYRDDAKPANVFTCDIDIQHDWQDIRSLEEGISDVTEASGLRVDPHNKKLKVELYVSKGEGDFANFGGPLELEFVTELMTEKGFYNSDAVGGVM